MERGLNKGERIAEKEKELKALEREEKDTKDIVSGLQQRLSTIARKINDLRNALRDMKPKNLQVSDHVVLRYLERNHGINVDGVRKEIKEMLEGAEHFGDLKVGGFIVKGNTVVTYVPPTGVSHE